MDEGAESEALWFQSAPSSQTGGNTPADRWEPTSASVSIRPQFANRRKRKPVQGVRTRSGVSIRPQFANRRKLPAQCSKEMPPKFQSAPSSQTGGNRSTDGLSTMNDSFNPPPVRKPEETDGDGGIENMSGFQSAPSSQTGGNSELPRRQQRSRCFNPPPVRKPEETPAEQEGCRAVPVSIRPQFANRRKRRYACATADIQCCFNPPPVRKPEET